MVKKFVIWVVGLGLAVICHSSAFADQSLAYQEYFKEGVKAFKEHDDQKALRCFKIAQIYDSSDEQLNQYINDLEQRAVTVQGPDTGAAPDESIGYKYYLSKGIEAYQNHDHKKAIHYFNLAVIFNPDSKEIDQYLEDLSQSLPIEKQVTAPAPSLPAEQPPQAPVMPQPTEQPEAQVVAPQVSPSQSAEPVPQPAAVMPQAPRPASQNAIYVPVPKAKMPVTEITLAQVSNNGQANPKLQIELGSGIILDGKNIRRFLVVEEGYLSVKIINTDRIQIDALRIGSTFLHIWDDAGRHSLYIEVLFPKAAYSASSPQEMNGVRHSQPFKVTYANDWDTYYSGRNASNLKRQSYNFDQSLLITGETPYGFFDTSANYTDFDSFSEFNTYTVGLSQIPLEGTSNFDIRGFDALRYLSPLTMPGTNMRGAFADVDLMKDTIGLSFSHGQEQLLPSFITMGNQSELAKNYIDAAKLTLFPKSSTDQYSLNFATGYGSDRPTNLTDHVYSAEGMHKFNDFLTLNAEEGSDTSHDAQLASLKWQDGAFRSGLNFRNVDKNYSTISSLPQYQGETGVAWTTDGDFKKFSESTFVEAYRDRLNANPDDDSAYNYDANGHLRTNLTDSIWSDSDFNFVDTPGEASPMSSVGLNERISKGFGIWNSLKGTVFTGTGYQNSNSSTSNLTNFNREDVIGGVQIPITKQVSSFANYEYDWYDQPHSGGSSNPSVVNSGFQYLNQLSPKTTFSSQVSYHDELGVKGTGSFLSGEESVILSSSINYNLSTDCSFYLDGNASKVMSHIGNQPFDDLEVHVGMRVTFGGASYWDPLGTVTGVVFKDKNGDGKFIQGDEGIPGVKVKVGDKEAVTDKNGRYSIQVRAKGVDVAPVIDTIPGGLLFSTPQLLSIQILQGRKVHADFGLASQTGIYGIVFVSKNGARAPSDGDKFIGKVKVVLDGKIIQKSDSHGAFYFRKVSPGEHTIAIDINSLALNMVPLLKLKNKIDVAEGTNYMFNIPVQVKKAEGDED